MATIDGSGCSTLCALCTALRCAASDICRQPLVLALEHPMLLLLLLPPAAG
jgi:hypothetical protein